MLAGSSAIVTATSAGALPCGTTVVLEPLTQTVGVGSTATVIATVTNSDGATCVGETVQFGVFAGPNAGVNGSATTDTAGEASFSYSSTKFGTDTLLANIPGVEGQFIFSNAVTVVWRTVQTGRAYGIAATGLIRINATPDTGAVATTGDTAIGPRCAVPLVVPGLASALTLCASIFTGRPATDSDNPGSLALAALENLTIGVPGLPVIQVAAIGAISGSQCAVGTKSFSTVAQLKIGGRTIIGGTSSPRPNTTIPLIIGKIILNEQKPVPGDFGLQVNSMHIIVPGLADVVIASATSDVHGCPLGSRIP